MTKKKDATPDKAPATVSGTTQFNPADPASVPSRIHMETEDTESNPENVTIKGRKGKVTSEKSGSNPV